MTDFAKTIDIAAPPSRVWAVMTDIEHWPDWTASVRNIQRLTPGPLAVGSRARIRQPKLAPALWEVTSLDPGRQFTWVTRAPGVFVTAHHRIEPAAGGSQVTLSVNYGGPLGTIVAWLTGGLNDRYLDLEATGLKRRSEQGSAR